MNRKLVKKCAATSMRKMNTYVKLQPDANRTFATAIGLNLWPGFIYHTQFYLNGEVLLT